MNDEIAAILKGYLSIPDETLKSLMNEIIDSSRSVKGTEDSIEQLESLIDSYYSSLDFIDRLPYCYLFLGYTRYKWHDSPQAAKCVSDAMEGFDQRNDVRNLAISSWISALIYWQNSHTDEARRDIQKAIKLMEQRSEDNKRTGHYKDCRDCNVIVEQMLMDAEQMGVHIATDHPASHTRQDTTNTNQKRTANSRGSLLVFPVYDPVRAGQEGNFIFDSQPSGEGTVEEILFDGTPYMIHNIREEGIPVTLYPVVYRWLKVEGNSMDQAEPVQILNKDYVLVVDIRASDYQPQYNDIVVAAVLNPLPDDRAGIIKKYTSKGLKSMSSQPYRLIPLQEVNIRGVVIAVAKPLA